MEVTDEPQIGSAPYSKIPAKSGPKAIFDRLREKCRLRAVLQAMQADIEIAVQALTPTELHELQGLIANEVEAADVDVAALSAQVDQEAMLAKTTRPMQVKIPRRAAAVLTAEVERRIARGVYPSAESLVGEAVAKAFAGGHP